MKRFVWVSVLVVVCLVVLGTQVMAAQCSICGRAINASCGSPCSCATAITTCRACRPVCAPCAITTVVPVVVAAPACPTPCPRACNTCASGVACNSCNTCNPCKSANAFDQMKYENAQAVSLIKRLGCAQQCEVADLYSQLRANLLSHIKAERCTLYSQVVDNACARKWVLMSIEQQEIVLNQLCALDQTAFCDDLWRTRYNNLREALGRSIFIEQDKVYPNAYAALGGAACLAPLCAAYNDQKAATLAAIEPWCPVTTTSFMPSNCFSGMGCSPGPCSTTSTTAPADNDNK